MFMLLYGVICGLPGGCTLLCTLALTVQEKTHETAKPHNDANSQKLVDGLSGSGAYTAHGGARVHRRQRGMKRPTTSLLQQHTSHPPPQNTSTRLCGVAGCCARRGKSYLQNAVASGSVFDNLSTLTYVRR